MATVAIMNASSVLAREVLQVMEDLEVEPFAEVRLFGTTADTFLRYRGKDLRIHARTAERMGLVQVALLGVPTDLGQGRTVVGLVDEASASSPLIDPVLEAGLPSHRGFVAVPRAAAAVIARIARLLSAKRVVATVLEPAGELGPLALTELYEQTMALFQHRPLPDAIFGGRLAFNILPGRAPLTGVERLAGCPVFATSLLLPVFAGTVISLDLESTSPITGLEDLLEDGDIGVHETVDPASIVGESGIRVVIQGTDGPRVRLLAVVDEARLTAQSIVDVARRLVAPE